MWKIEVISMCEFFEILKFKLKKMPELICLGFFSDTD